MPFHPEPPKLSQHGGTDIKRTEMDPDKPQESKEAKDARWKSVSLVEDKTKGSFLNVTGSNTIQAKDPLKALDVKMEDRTPPGKKN